MSTSNEETGPSSSHEIRITNHGKIKSWVTFALQHFRQHEDKAIVLHTLPALKDAAAPAAHDDVSKDEPKTTGGKKAKGDRLHPSMSTIPRLVSVVEIIKREYLKTVDPSSAEAGSLLGLHQYNEIGDLEEAGYIERSGNEDERVETLARALQGRNHLKQKKIAFMRVTLCRKAIPELVGRGATYQKPSVRKLSKSTRARLKKKRSNVKG